MKREKICNQAQATTTTAVKRDSITRMKMEQVKTKMMCRALTVKGREKSHHKPSQFKKVPMVTILLHIRTTNDKNDIVLEGVSKKLYLDFFK